MLTAGVIRMTMSHADARLDPVSARQYGRSSTDLQSASTAWTYLLQAI